MCFFVNAFAQSPASNVTIEFGSKNLTLDQPFLISVVIRDSESRPSILFPEIKDLEKRSKTATSSVSTVDGKKVVIQTITQEYYATKPGNYLIPEFNITVNATRLHSEETMIVFGKAQSAEALEDDSKVTVDAELESNKEDIFISVQTDKKTAYIREGFALRVSLYIAENAPVEMEFYRFNEQLQFILKKLRPANCWEENVGIEEIVKRRVQIRGRSYTEYNMYQARLFPFTTEHVNFPAVSLDMLVNDHEGAVNVENKVIRKFRSKPFSVFVKQLPDHPLRDQVAVGQYHLKEQLSGELVYPGESVRYVFKVEGTGNIKAIPAPIIQAGSSLDIYPPEVSQVIRRTYQSVAGEKAFDYFVVPKKDGKFILGRYFQWIYFNTADQAYDTLRSSKMLEVKGEDYQLANLSLNGSPGLYDNLESLDSTQESISYKQLLKDATNIIVVILLITMIWVFRR
ncbi:BatD family protein [Dyadobacter sandarakinus]|uniref:BatD family protein n=1 Tax=Dyadobacter sandarakinus TaxID=2747268 RepID=UPI001E2EEA05|nr:BatD family protein [Dyadobacter sandarakinus]